MSITSDIAAILADETLTAEEKRLSIYALKAGRVGDQAEAIVGNSYDLGGGYRVTVTQPPSIEGDRSDLVLYFSATYDGEPLPVDMPLIIRNVPIIVDGVESPLAALRAILLEHCARAR